MILFQNEVLTLSYTSVTRVLSLNFPDLQAHTIARVKHSLDTLAVMVAEHQVRAVLLDCSKTTVAVHEDVFKLVTNYLLIGLKSASVERVAYLPFRDRGTEALASSCFNHLAGVLSSFLQLRKLYSHCDAQVWLSGVKLDRAAPAPHAPAKRQAPFAL
ncbi:hypothetical protein [Pontibacter mangrovi]|uniref:Uncharacterized protein n=1 Tax=Pontibacter mangrovi TaxID=2589816 RepID=A0A501VV99_9BACT|nr:hypothetical protein [Pontibacter mangrovi]TPE39734.1 hypothetical protein FJM65_20840 [Pontibacter mangrovi]